MLLSKYQYLYSLSNGRETTKITILATIIQIHVIKIIIKQFTWRPYIGVASYGALGHMPPSTSNFLGGKFRAVQTATFEFMWLSIPLLSVCVYFHSFFWVK